MEPVGPLTEAERRLEERALAPLRGTSRGYLLLAAVLVAVIAWGGYAYYRQIQDGLYVTGMRDRISWGLYIALFVFFVGASMGGTFVSAILRLTDASWRAPITRGAEFVTVSALICAGFIITVNMSNVPRVMENVLRYARWESQLVWDVYGLITYLTGSLVYLYVAMIPDLARCRDALGGSASFFRRHFFRITAVSYRGDPVQVRSLGLALLVMTLLIVPVAVMMHTVTSWIFGMMLREPWDNPMFGIYFVAGAVYSGVGLIAILMFVIRRAYGMEEYLTKRHFVNLGVLLAGFAGVMLFFQASEFITASYKMAGDTPFHLHQMVHGGLSWVFWTYIWAGLVLPIVIVLIPYTRTMIGVIIASILANIGMFLERFFIVVGGLRVPLNPYDPATYWPTWVEWSLMAAVFALFALMIMVMLKLVPGISISEVLEHGDVEAAGEDPATEPQPETAEVGA